MNIKKHIPNFITCLNLLCGCFGVVAFYDSLLFFAFPSFMILMACIFDFIDGFAARLLKVSSPIGKELDSLADMVSFGLLPGLIIFRMIESPISIPGWNPVIFFPDFPQDLRDYLKYFAFLIPVFSALRLAKFNVDERQSTSFIGVPTPANAILIASIPLIAIYSKTPENLSFIFHPYFLVFSCVLLSYLLVAEIPLFALKFKDFTWQNNKIRYIFIIFSVVLLLILQIQAIPLVIFSYIILSVVENKLINKKMAE